MKTKEIKDYKKQISAIAHYFKELRFNENLTQTEAATESGLHRNTISNVENSCNYEIVTLLHLCDFYAISVSDLFEILNDI